MTTPETPVAGSGANDDESERASSPPEGAGAEISMSDGEGSTFEPEEDPEAAS